MPPVCGSTCKRAIPHLEDIQEGENPSKEGGGLIETEETKHPCQPQQRQEDHRSREQLPEKQVQRGNACTLTFFNSTHLKSWCLAFLFFEAAFSIFARRTL